MHSGHMMHQVREILAEHKTVSRDIGRIRDVKNNEEMYVKFSMKPEAVPIAQKPRPVAYYLQKPLKAWLEQSIAEGIFEKVPPNEPITWCSPIVVQPKPRFLQVPKQELQPHIIRVCVDLRVPNKFMARHRGGFCIQIS